MKASARESPFQSAHPHLHVKLWTPHEKALETFTKNNYGLCMFTIWQCDSQHLLASATDMKEVHVIKSPFAWKQLLQRGLEYSAAHRNVLPRMHHSLTPHDKESPPKAVLNSAGAESALSNIFSFFFYFQLQRSKICANPSSLRGIPQKYNKTWSAYVLFVSSP